uniref:uncharacterized protein LOC120952879 n=1 Tax=Anopheles coluzzii TaxID=1518534 RepID=UPI0020FF96A9|nr:uncharacterized protein LOC120952879 [Anopheles coluzzii]
MSSRRTILIAILARYEEFLQNYQPDRDSIEVETRTAKFDQICKDLESLQQQLEDSATAAEEMTHNAALREDFERRLIRVQSALKAKYREIPRSEVLQQGAVDKVIADLPAHDVSTRGWNIPSEFVLADPQFDKSAPIDLILGARHYASFFTNVKSHELAPNLPTMLNSVFGWVMIGPTSPQNPASPTDCTAASTIVCMASLEESLERFWKLEELSVNDSYSPDERRCETLYKETTQRDESGRYIVRLPKQTDFTEKLGLSKTTALRRFELLERRLERNPQLKEDYHAFMKEYLELGHMSLMTKIVGMNGRTTYPDGEGTEYALARAALKRNFYVDDFIGGANNVREAVQLRMELSALLAKAPSISAHTHPSLPNETIKALGISWKPESDELCFESNTEADEATSTKRSILSSIAKMYDPLGLIAPMIVRTKMLMQELWLLKSGWDEPVPNHICKKWKAIQSDWKTLSEYRTNRYALLPDATVEFHTFTDASEAAYGACVYARCENAAGEVRISLLAPKSRVAPLKRVTLPRFELSATVLGAHLHHRVKEAMQIVCAESFFWSDSTLTLKWIASPPNSWKTFVANRVAEVQHYSHPRQWRHVPGTSNPADLVSRGMSAAHFTQNQLWNNGPDWLVQPSSHWPSSDPEPSDEADLETRQKARSQRPIPHTNASKTITPEYVDAAKTVLCIIAQHDAFSAEIKQLKKGEALMKQSPLRKLTPFLDTEEVIRVGGRLNLSQLPYQSKHPAVLPKNHKFTRLLAEDYHEELKHTSGRLLLSRIRELYWPLDGRRLVKTISRNCFRCVRQDPALARQPVGQLPPSRITPSRPFSVTGVDYAGDLTTAGFLAALRRFTSRRGLPAHIHSDNGKNFEGAERELKELFELFNDEQHRNTVATRCADRRITWHFNPPKAPHFGGLWEAAVKTAKRHLYRHLSNTRLSYEGYCTVLHQIEAAMNSRPLLPLSDDPNELAALTPAHFLIGTSMFAVPEPDYTQLKFCTLDDLQKWQLLVQRFWKHWATEYLQEMPKSYANGGSNNSNILPGS